MKIAKRNEVEFDDDLQLLLLDELHAAGKYQSWRLHAAATEANHLHVLLSWSDDRTPGQIREKLHESMTRRLNKAIGNQKWLSKGGNERRVKDQEHFDYLKNVYLPSHRGWRWDEQRGLYKEGDVADGAPASC